MTTSLPSGRPLRVLWVGGAAGTAAAAEVERAASADEALQHATRLSFDALVLELPAAEALAVAAAPAWVPLLRDVAVLFVVDGHGDAGPADDVLAERLIAAGAQDLLLPAERADADAFVRRLRHAVRRKAVERDARRAWSTDLHTGLPNQAQLVEHLSQLIALRARQPAPMALLVLRIDGLDAIGAQHGAEAAQVVRRKVAVRLRASVRSSDVVAALGGDVFALLLAKIEAPADAQRVAIKLARALREPFSVVGAAVSVAAHVGVALYPADGAEPEPLLRHASATALAAQRRKSGAANE